MQKAKYLFLCVIVMFFAFSCELDEYLDYIEIRVFNTADEDILIYYHRDNDPSLRYHLTTIRSHEAGKSIQVVKGRTYYTEGRISERSYGYKTFYDENATWIIR